MKTAVMDKPINSDIKTQANEILAKLGMSDSAFINLAYKKLVERGDLPFETESIQPPKAIEDMTEEEHREILEKSLASARAGNVYTPDEVYEMMLARIYRD